MSNVTDLRSSVDMIRSLCADIRCLAPLVEECLSWLDDVLGGLQSIDDPHARNAEGDVRRAQSELREALSVWLNDYVSRSEDLCQRILG